MKCSERARQPLFRSMKRKLANIECWAATSLSVAQLILKVRSAYSSCKSIEIRPQTYYSLVLHYTAMGGYVRSASLTKLLDELPRLTLSRMTNRSTLSANSVRLSAKNCRSRRNVEACVVPLIVRSGASPALVNS